MAIIVRATPPVVPSPAGASASVRNGLVIGGRDWTYLAAAFAYARGRGCVLVPAFAPLRAVLAGATATFNFRAYQRYPCIQRLWFLRMHRATVTGGESTVVTLKAPSGGTAQTYGVSSLTHIGAPTLLLLEDNVTQTAGEVNLSLDIINGSASTSLILDEIGCIELPRLTLAAGGTEAGVDANTERGGEAMFDGSAAGESIGGVRAAYVAVTGQTNRPLYSWGAPDASALTTASTTDVDLFQPTGGTTGNPKVRVGVGTKVARTATTKVVQLRARMKVSGAGVGGRILVTTRLGATATLTCTVGTTTFAWYTATVAVDCTDMTTSDGRRSAASEELSVVWKNTGTAGTVSCSAFEVLDG